MKYLFIIIFFLLGILKSDSQTVGLIQNNAGSLDSGYVLFAPISSTTTYMIDKCGRQVKTWTSAYKPGQSVYFLTDGTIMRPGNVGSIYFNQGGEGGIIEKFDWDGNIVWSYLVSDSAKCQHHDIEVLPNGNVLVIAWEKKTAADAIALGRDPSLVHANVWSEQILEIQPVGANGGNIVWEWHLWDHLIQDYDVTKPNYGVVSSSPQLVNINYDANIQTIDLYHLNSINYNESLDQIMVSSRKFNEIYIIDHSTTTAEASGHSGGNSGKGGDLLYRWGNPEAYDNGTNADQKFFGQHCAQWIGNNLPDAGQIMVFNNGEGRPGGNYSTVEILEPPVNGYNYNSILPFLPSSASWIYNDGNPYSFYAPRISGGQQLSNGNVLICSGTNGTFTEVDSTESIVWKYINPVSNTGIISQGNTPSQNQVFRCVFYPYDYDGFTGHTLIAGSIIENSNPVSDTCNLSSGINEYSSPGLFTVYPNPVSDACTISFNDKYSQIKIEIYSSLGVKIKEFENRNGSGVDINLSKLPDGIYFLSAYIDNTFPCIKKIIVAR